MKFTYLIFVIVAVACSGTSTQDEPEQGLREELEVQQKADTELENGLYNNTFYRISNNQETKATLELSYIMDWAFAFELILESSDSCSTQFSDQFMMHSSFQGVYRGANCLLEFNFKGYDGQYGYRVEIRQPELCEDMVLGCTLEGTYASRLPSE